MGNLKDVFMNKQFQGIAIAQMLTVFGSTLLSPILPVYLKGQGLSDSQIGLIIGISAFGALIFRPWAGKSVDKHGSHPLVLVGQVLTMISISAFIWTSGFIPLLLTRLLQGIASSFYGTAAVTFASSIGSGQYAESAVAFYSVFTMVGMGIAASGGPLLFHILDFHPLVFLSLATLAMAICFFAVRTIAIPPFSQKKRASFGVVLKSKEVFVPTVCQFASNFTFSAGFTYVPLYAISQHVTSYSIFFVTFTVAVVAVRMSVQYINMRWSSEKSALIASFLNVFSMAILALSANGFIFAIAGILIGLGFGIIFPSMAGFVVNHTQPANRGTALSILTASGDVGFALGASVLGGVADFFGYQALFIVSTFVVLVCTIYYYMAFFYQKS